MEKKKWVDDCTLTCHVRLKNCLRPNTKPKSIGPANFHDRTGQMLPLEHNQMQSELDLFNEYCLQSKLKINQEKSKCMLFNRAKNYDFSPELYLTPGSKLEVVDEMKLVGYQLRSDLSTVSNTKYIVKRAWKRMWVVRRLKALGANEKELLNVLRAQVLSVLQFATPAWSTLITAQESAQIEAVLKTGLFLVYGQRYLSFSWALKESNMKTMKEQRSIMFENFTKRSIENPKFKQWFVRTNTEAVRATRQMKPMFKPIHTRTQGFARSAIPQMVQLVNSPQFQKTRNKLILKTGEILHI